MLKQRIITASILIPIFVLLVLKMSASAFCIFTGVIVMWGAWEWSFFMGLKKLTHCLLYPIVLLALLLLSAQVYIPYVLYAAVAWWVFAFILVKRYPATSQAWGKSVLWRGVMGVLVLVPCWFALNFIRNAPNGPEVLLFLFILIWGADTGAYFAGRKWGKTKLAPLISPGKTWEGLAGALLLTLLIALGALYFFEVDFPDWPIAMLICVVTVLFSVLGDLFESMLKRNAGLKDSGFLLPGHGGILDRIDSLTAAAPIFAAGELLVGKLLH